MPSLYVTILLQKSPSLEKTEGFRYHIDYTFQQFQGRLFGVIVGAQFTTEGTGEDGFFKRLTSSWTGCSKLGNRFRHFGYTLLLPIRVRIALTTRPFDVPLT